MLFDYITTLLYVHLIQVGHETLLILALWLVTGCVKIDHTWHDYINGKWYILLFLRMMEPVYLRFSIITSYLKAFSLL